ncbi:MAG: DUF1553 domain-containing protein [Fuerstiella sp.]|jgi:hypothetical protein|nr:DUF1553 domain-containing protein [Fuerstiella sp.]
MRNDFVFVSVCTLLTAGISLAEEANPVERVRFNEHIRPILSEYCFACHGPDSGSRKGDLRLDVREAAVDSGAVVEGNAENSQLIVRITSDDAELVMPPPDSHKTLKPEHRQLLIQWIREGAAYENHWSFIKPQRPQIPESAGHDGLSANAIDHFILQKLDGLGLKPTAAADRHVLARRAALDVTGLPVTPDTLQSFIGDSSDDAWSTYVDRLLTSEHAGEHRARYWLDAARYGDTHGMHVDNYREMWPYRDWVVRAFNANMPFDRFVVEQLAGDLLPEPTQDQLIATGFSRCNITTSEGGAIPAELDVRYMVDRVETTATVFLGLTAGCAVCHDHKYDPISIREFYQLGAFFNNTTTPAMDGNQKDTPPVVTLPSEEFEKEWNDLRALRTQLSSEFDALSSDAAVWWPSRNRDLAHPVSTDELITALPLTDGEGVDVALPESADWATEHPAGRRGIRFGEKGQLTADLPGLRTDEPLSISFWYRTPERLMSTTVFDQTAKTEDKKTIGWKIAGNTQGGLTFEFNDGKGKKIRALLPGEEALTPRSWQHVCVRYSGGQSNSSITILVNGRAGVLRNSTEDLMGAVEVPAGKLRIASRLPTAGLSDIRIFRRWLTDEETRLLAQEHGLTALIQSDRAWDDLDEEQQASMTSFHRATINSDGAAKLRQYAGSQRRRDFIYSRSTTTLVIQERDSKPRAWVLERGEYDRRGEEVAPWVPDILNFPGTAFRGSDVEPGRQLTNRLDLARWLVHPDHPLTARVMVNRLWQSVFGTGLVKTSEDFGVMGERPSHPELLDWLAVEFVQSGWNVNHILKLILTSSTYRQSGVVTAEILAQDADNRYLARGPRIRLDAEVLRDQALAVSGLLRRDMGGPSVKPYQPAGLWKVVAITGSNTRIFSRDSGDGLYRRSVYSFWKRTAPPPSMAAFNAPTREQCTVRRERTNTPIQALVLMNDPQFVESARRLAENTIRQEADDQSRARWMLSAVLSRPAEAVDVADMIAAASDLKTMFQQQPEAAKDLISTGDTTPDETLDAAEVAAWTLVANTLMNRDDFVSK